MKFTIIPILALLVLPFFAVSQTAYSIKGSVIDTASSIKLSNAAIAVLNAKDSILTKFTRSAADGSFSITNPGKGKLLLMVTYPGYADYVEDFSLDSINPTHDFKSLNMILKASLLKEVLIQGTAAAIKIKGDTTEFNPRAYIIQPNSKVEDLLKQLPGIQVDKDGKITAQGQTVSKVLVDGEEFFGDDPTLVTKNIRGDMVDKIQLFDKKSDQATFTGVDDGQTTKTINLKLKEDSKNGYFGKIDAAAGSEEFYQAQLMFNVFKAKQKFSAYGTLGNTGRTGLSWEDNSKYGSSSNVQVSDDGGIYITGGGDDLESFSGRYNGEGIPEAQTGGLHYDSKWNSDKETINANYKAGSLGISGNRNNLSQNNLPSGLISSNSDQRFDNTVFRQKVDLTYQVKLDSSSNLKLMVDGTLKKNKTNSNYLSSSARENAVLLNKGNRDLTNDEDQKQFNASALWTKKFKKAGRTVSLNLSEALNENKGRGFLNSENSFFNPSGSLDSIQNIDQLKDNLIKSNVLNTNLSYTEPLSKKLSLALNYGVIVSNSSADRKSFNKSGADQYSILDPTFSNNYQFDQLSNVGGAVFNFRTVKTTILFGTRTTRVNFKQTDLYTGTEYKRNFLNWMPQASYQYKFNTQKSLRLSYNGNTSQPSIDQLQPIRINTDPLNITLGNPDLKPSFRNTFNLNYNSYKVLSDQNIYLSSSYTFTANPLVTNIFTDEAGKTTIQSINLSQKPANIYFYGYISKKLKKSGLSVGLNTNVNLSKNYGLSNNVLNEITSNSYSGSLSLSKYVQKKYDFYVSFGPSYSANKSSVQRQISNNGIGFTSSASFNVYLPGKVQVGSDSNYQHTGKTQTFNTAFDRVIWNTTITKKFLKSESLAFAISGNDLLNQNVGFRRNASSSIVTQNSFTTIQRYFMFSATWDFSKMGGASTSAKK